jgi:hypothetical protein
MHRLIQKKSSTKTTKFFQILHFDLIINIKTFDETTCIAHFIDELIFYTWVYSLINHKKKTLLSIFRNLINFCDRMTFDERAIIRIIRISQEIFIKTSLKNWISAQDIKWDWSIKNTSEQNKKSKHFDEMLIKKAKCIKQHAKLFEDLYSKCYFAAVYILNRTSIQSQEWNSSLISLRKLIK